MADTIHQADYFYLQVPHKTGTGAKILRTLKDANVNLLAFSGFPAGRRAQLDFIPCASPWWRRANISSSRSLRVDNANRTAVTVPTT